MNLTLRHTTPLMIITLLLALVARAHYEYHYLDDITVRFYSGHHNITECLDMVNLYHKYFDSVKEIRIMDREPGRYAAYYFWQPQVITLNRGCVERHLQHELAHAKNKQDGYSFRESASHNVTFVDALVEIKSWGENMTNVHSTRTKPLRAGLS